MRSLLLTAFWTGQMLFAGTNAAGAELKPETVRDFLQYVQATEARIQKQVARPATFLYFDNLAEPRRSQIHMSVLRGEIFMEPLETRNPSGAAIEIHGGLVHHWIGAVFIPQGTVRQVLDLVEDYNHHQDVYRPDVVRSRLLSHTDNEFKVFMRFRQRKVITVTLDTVHEVRYVRVDDAHWYSQSTATRIAEVENADKPNEREKPPGNDSGFLWRLNSYWRFVEREGGVYVECESVSLTRTIPTGLGWLVGPFVTSVPKESLQRTLGSTRSAILARLMASDDAYEILLNRQPTGVIELPIERILDDYPYFGASDGSLPSPDLVEQTFASEFDVAYDEAGLYVLTMHPHIIALAWQVSKTDPAYEVEAGVWFATEEDITRYLKDQYSNTKPLGGNTAYAASSKEPSRVRH